MKSKNISTKTKFKRVLEFLNQPVMIMLVPHSKKSSFNFKMTYKSCFLLVAFFTFSLLYLSIKILHYSNSVNKVTQTKISNIDFSEHIKTLEGETASMKKSISFYKEKISNLHNFLVLQNSNLMPKRPAIGGPEDLVKMEKPNSIYQMKEYINDIKISNELLKDISKVLKQKQPVSEKIPSIWPVAKGYILYPFGTFFDPISGNFIDNLGVGISTAPNEKVEATAPGIITSVDFLPDYGYCVKIKHKYSWKTSYANMKQVYVKRGDKVDRKTVIGIIGRTKFNPNHYLDYKISIGTKIVNPFHFLSTIPN